jgi:DNA-directed RNA polymerase subunit F
MIGMVLTLDITSNIAERLVELMKKIPIKAIETARSKLYERLVDLVGPKQKELQRIIDQRSAGIKDSLTSRNEYLKKLAQIEMEKSKELTGLPFSYP